MFLVNLIRIKPALIFSLQLRAYRLAHRFHRAKEQRAVPPAPRTPWPSVHGLHTAVVVGPRGQEIWCDKYGRVKLQFPWDRYGTSDEIAPCWVPSATVGAMIYAHEMAYHLAC